jgi:acyl carrier protein
MTDAEILAGIEEVARAHLGWGGRLDGGMRLVEDLGLDSLKALTLAVEVENRFEICLDPERDSQLVTVADLVAAVRNAGDA